MNCRRLSVLVGILAAFSSALGGAEEKLAVLKEADIRAILEAGQRANLPAGVFIRVEAQLSRCGSCRRCFTRSSRAKRRRFYEGLARDVGVHLQSCLSRRCRNPREEW